MISTEESTLTMENIKILKIVLIACCFVIATFAGCTCALSYQTRTAMVEMVSNGADPLAARCAVSGLEYSACSILAAGKTSQ